MTHLKFLFFCLALITCQTSQLYAQGEKLISPKKLVKDFDYLEKVIDAHPDPYTHISEKDFKAKFDSVKSTLNKPLSILEFYKKAASVVALIRDGHSSVRFPRFWFQTQRKNLGAFPYEVHLTNENELYVIKNFNKGEMRIGAKIITINGMKVNDFLKEIDPYISYERLSFRNTIIDGNFEAYLYLVFGQSDNTKIEYFTSDTSTVTTKNMPYKEWKKFQKDNREEREAKIKKGEPYAYKKLDDGVGLLNIYAFSVYDLQAYNMFLSKTFRHIKKDGIHSLIIDVRGNFGGWPKIASRLFHYISDSHFKTKARSRMKVSYTYRNNMLTRYPYLRTANISFFQERHRLNMQAILKNPLDSYVDEEAFFNEPPNTENFEFDGDCYLLINRDSYSAASSFASTFQCYQMGIIVGEETGGTKIFRANAIYEKLIKSGLRVGMSTTKMFTACYNEEFEGVQPTIEYIPSIIEITSDIDAQLLFTQRLIKMKPKE